MSCKKIIAMLVTATMVIGLLPQIIFADQTYPTYSFDFGSGHEDFVEKNWGNFDWSTLDWEYLELDLEDVEISIDDSVILVTVKKNDPKYYQAEDIILASYRTISGVVSDSIDDDQFFMGYFAIKDISEYKSSFEAEQDLYQICNSSENQTVYALWAKPINATITVVPPVCGTVVEYHYRAGTSDYRPGPELSIEGTGVSGFLDYDILYNRWDLSEFNLENDYGTTLTMTGGNTYIATGSIQTDWGYYVPENVEDVVTVVGAKDYEFYGTSFKNSFSLSVEVEHTIPDDAVIVPATCTAEGSITYTCPGCGEKIDETIPAKGHDWSDWDITKEAEINVAGERKHTCKDCGITETEAIPALNGYKIIWLNGDGTELDNAIQLEGEAMPVTSKIPTKASDKYFNYVFTSWKEGIIEGDTIKIFPQFEASLKNPYMSDDMLVAGMVHIQDVGNVGVTVDPETGIMTLGTTGQSKRLEEIMIFFNNTTGYEGNLQYRVHVQDIGWMDWVDAGQAAGTFGLSKRIEAIEMRLTGELAEYYSIEYCVHIQDYGDGQGWVKDGALAGTTGESKRIEQLKVRIVPIGSDSTTSVKYKVHVQDYGWEDSWASNGQMSGTQGQSKRLEGIQIFLSGCQYSGGIQYKTHIQDIAWESSWIKNGEMSGTQGQSKRLEAIAIELYGEISDYYDIYYRVHAQDIGWLAWAKNGEFSGTAGRSARLEGIQIVLVPKGEEAPGTDYEGITSVTSYAFIEGF